MAATPSTRLLLLAAAVVAVVGCVDAVISGEGDFVAVFGLLGLLLLTLLLRLGGRRRPLTLRADLAGWVNGEAALRGEPVERVVDRAVAAYRAGLTPDRPAEGGAGVEPAGPLPGHAAGR